VKLVSIFNVFEWRCAYCEMPRVLSFNNHISWDLHHCCSKFLKIVVISRINNIGIPIPKRKLKLKESICTVIIFFRVQNKSKEEFPRCFKYNYFPILLRFNFLRLFTLLFRIAKAR